MDLYNTIVSICFIVPMVFTYHHKIYLSVKPNIAGCNRINDTVHYCYSLIPMLDLLSEYKGSIDVFIQSGVYILNVSYTLEDLYNIQLRSNVSKSAIIKCYNNNSSDVDAGIASLRVHNLTIEHLSIVGCGMKHISSSYHGKGYFISVYSAIFIQNSTNIFLVSVNISYSIGIGLLMYDTGGLVNITQSVFTSNKLDSLDPKGIGGGIHIEFTECTPGLVLCDSHDNPYNEASKYIIDHCTFKDNAATYSYRSSEAKYIHFTDDNFVTFGSGGGLSLWFNGQAKNNSVKVISSHFIANHAKSGGGLHVHSRQNATQNHVEISRCRFIENVGNREGGGLSMGHVIHQRGGLIKFNMYNITDCLFEQNQALTGVGGGVVAYGSRETENRKPTNRFEIHNSLFIHNKALFGSAIQVNKQYFDSTTTGFMLALVLKDCNFTSNNLHDSSHTNLSSIGAVAMSGVNIEFWGYTHFINNTSTALMVDAATVKFCNDSVTVFQDNSGLHGGAILLIEGASIIVYPNSTVIFLRNTAVELGGAIYVELSTPFDYLLSHVCFIRYYLETVLPGNWETNFTFINNTARQSNSSIFTSTLQPCTKAYINGTCLFDKKPFYHYPNSSDSNISTLPETFKFFNSSNKFCSTVSDKPYELVCNIVPGEMFDLPIILEDELEERVDDAMFIATCTGPQSPNVLSPYHFTNGTIQIAGKQNDVCHLQLQTDTDYPASTIVNVNLLNCPPGLVYNANKQQCQCVVNYTPQIPAITGCEITHLQAYYNKFYWIGYESDDATGLLYGICPNRYCYTDHIPTGHFLPRDANKTILDKFVCGGRRRTGVLCGQCIEGYSVMMNSPTSSCHKCDSAHLGILYLILSYILPVSVLFYIIMSYNIRMTTGLISAYLFFSQIIGNHYYYTSFKANTDLAITTFNIITAIYGISNLELFQHDIFSYCLFPNAGTIDILAFKLLVSFYPFCMVFIYFILRRYCICKHQCFQKWRLSSKSITHGISAFLVLCFAKINILAFGILKHIELSYMNGESYGRVVYLQGEFKYFEEPLYNVYAISSLLTLVIIITIPMMILMLHPIIINIAIYFECGESRFVLLINRLLLIDRLKPVLDTFQGDYKDKMHFFAGLHFIVYRIIFLCIVVMASTADVNHLYLLVITYFLVILLIHVLVMPFKRFINNAAYSLVYITLIMIVNVEYIIFSTGDSSNELIWIEIFLALLPLLCTILYFSWKLFSSAKAYLQKHKIESKNDQKPLVSACSYCIYITSHYG